MSQQYKWAVNDEKLQRAIASCRDQGEAAIREEYIRIGGKLSNEDVEYVAPAELAKEEEVVVETKVEVTQEESHEDVPVNTDPVPAEELAPEAQPEETPKEDEPSPQAPGEDSLAPSANSSEEQEVVPPSEVPQP